MSDTMSAHAAIFEEVGAIGAPATSAAVVTAPTRLRIPPPPAAYLTEKPELRASPVPPSLRDTAGRVGRAVLATLVTVRFLPDAKPGVSIVFGGSDADIREESRRSHSVSITA